MNGTTPAARRMRNSFLPGASSSDKEAIDPWRRRPDTSRSARLVRARRLELATAERLEHFRKGPAFIESGPHPRRLLGCVHWPARGPAAAAPHVDDRRRGQQTEFHPAPDSGLVSASRRGDLGRRRPFRALRHRRSLPGSTRRDPLVCLAVLMQSVRRISASSVRPMTRISQRPPPIPSHTASRGGTAAAHE